MTQEEKDKELYDEVLKAGYDYAQMQRLQGLCITENGRERIRRLIVKRYHQEEFEAGLL